MLPAFEASRGNAVRAHRRTTWAVLLAALFACAPACAGLAMQDDGTNPPGNRAAAFDQVFRRVVGPASLDASSAAYEADLQRLRSLLPAGDAPREIRFRSVYCGSERWREPRTGLAYSDQALRMARDARDVPSEARALLCRAYFIEQASGSQRALPEVDKAIALLQGGQDRQLLAEALETRGDIYSLLGEQAKAMLDFQRARAAYRAAGIEHEVESLMLSVAIAYRRMGDWPQAERYFTEAIGRMRGHRDWEGVATNLIQLGFLHDESGAPDQARAAFQQAIDVAGRHDDATSLNAARLGLAEAQIELGNPQAALETLALARAGFAAEQDDSNEDMLLILSGEALARQGQHVGALERYRQALPLVRRNGNGRYLALLYKAKSASEEALGWTADALADYKRYTAQQLKLQGKMRMEQGRLLEYEYEIRRREFENLKLRADAATRQRQLEALERVRHWQALALGLGALLVAVLGVLAWRQWRKSGALHTLAMQDPLTGAASRIGIEDEAGHALGAAAQTGEPVSLMVLDLDHFKTVNDRFGHAAGDEVLRAVVAAWTQQLRQRDSLGRVGGEEFVIVCPETTEAQALVVADRLLDATRALRFAHIDPELRLTVSVGLAQSRRDDDRDALFDRADAALYRAKQRGRDRAET
jgi:diguanylate cyclase (GGDEF)-like protein